MSYVIAAPEMMTAAAADLATIGSDLSAAHLAAAAPTVALVPAAADEVSAAVTHLFSQHAAGYQALAGQAAAFQEQFVQHLHAGAFSYANIEAAIAAFLQDLQELPAVVGQTIAADIAFIAADPLQFLWLLLFALVVAPPFALFAAFWIGVIVGLVILFQLGQLLNSLLASFGI
jgi:hypothetical protein